MTTVHLLRHAKAKNRLEWEEPDDLRPLAKRGRREAEVIAACLAPRAPVRLVSSPYLRCVQTLEPLGAAIAAPVETADILAEGAGGDGALALVLSLAPGGLAVCCTHGDVVFEVASLVADAGVALDGPRDVPVAAGWGLGIEDGSVVSARFLPQPQRSG